MLPRHNPILTCLPILKKYIYPPLVVHKDFTRTAHVVYAVESHAHP